MRPTRAAVDRDVLVAHRGEVVDAVHVAPEEPLREIVLGEFREEAIRGGEIWYRVDDLFRVQPVRQVPVNLVGTGVGVGVGGRGGAREQPAPGKRDEAHGPYTDWTTRGEVTRDRTC